jgi:hypothetical protein
LAASRAWKKTSGFWAVPRSTGRLGFSAARRCRDQLLVDQRAQVVVVEQRDLVDLVEVRKPSKKWRNGTRDSSVAAWAIEREVVGLLHRAEASIAKPVCGRPSRRCGRRRSTARGWRSCGRDVDDRRRQLAGDLEHVGDHQQQALEAVKVVVSAPPGGRRAAPGGAALALHLDHLGHHAPQVGPAGCDQASAVLAHRRGGVIG